MTEREFAEIIRDTKGVVLSAIGNTLAGRFYYVIDDVVQETYIRAYRGLVNNSFRGEAALSSWLYRIARNESLRMMKKLVREEEKSMKVAGEMAHDYEMPAGDAADDRDVEKLETMKRSIGRLPAKYQDVFELLLQGYPEKEIARKLSIRGGTVKSRISRGKEMLARMIEGGREK